jgi:hypothetical protein
MQNHDVRRPPISRNSLANKDTKHLCQGTLLRGMTTKRLEIENLSLFTYRKVASSRLSWLVAHLRIFRLFMKGKFDGYVL